MRNLWLLLGAISGFVAVSTGAFGAHALKARLSPDLLAVFETGSRYQLVHALALCLIGVLTLRSGESPSSLLPVSGALFAAGTLLFSGSLYILALSGQRMWGAVTPLGGLCFLAAWALLALYAARG
ncbi:MAG TPA: DUF423 domain-containing protein [Pseudomonadota bacterium]|jgi:uncharacterized membrane protein YgdD (TMEM256/DUF423 family)|nr:DUF423 domain-containing protein [Pseudomonadota bacterium]